MRTQTTTKNGHKDIEALALEAKKARMEKCLNEIQSVLDNNNCALEVMVGVGQQEAPLRAILALPSTIKVISKT